MNFIHVFETTGIINASEDQSAENYFSGQQKVSAFCWSFSWLEMKTFLLWLAMKKVFLAYQKLQELWSRLGLLCLAMLHSNLSTNYYPDSRWNTWKAWISSSEHSKRCGEVVYCTDKTGTLHPYSSRWNIYLALYSCAAFEVDFLSPLHCAISDLFHSKHLRCSHFSNLTIWSFQSSHW